MIFEEELKEKGFEFIPSENELSKVMYEFSDFEILTFYVKEHNYPDGSIALCITDLEMYDYINDCYYFQINYELFFKDINKFYELLTLLNYPIETNMLKTVK